MNDTINDFEKDTREQRMVGEFLEAFDPILNPFESLAKHGISLSGSFIGITGTAVAVLDSLTTIKSGDNFLLFLSWILFIIAIILGTIQLWQITSFRDHLRKFAFVLLGDSPSANDKKKAQKIARKSYKVFLNLEYIFLVLGLVLFVLWATKRASIL